MKKAPLMTLNFRFMRIPLLLCTFFVMATVCTKLSFSVPTVNLSNNLIETILGSGYVLKNTGHSGVFSLMKIVRTSQAEKTAESISSPSETEHTQLPQKSDKPAQVKVSHSTDYDININDYLTGKPAFLEKDISVLIVHTHTTESYTPSEKYNYIPSDTDRTRDKEFNTVRVGKEIADILEANGIRVHHDTTINDYPSYNGSYNRSSMNVQNAIQNDSSIKIVLDIHRDAIEGANGEKVKYTFTKDGKTGACVMFVVGSNLSGLTHGEWKTNMQFAATLQQHIQSFYPDLMRPINFRSQRFNQHLAPGAVIVEVGTNGNTLEEALFGAECFANALADYLKK